MYTRHIDYIADDNIICVHNLDTMLVISTDYHGGK